MAEERLGIWVVLIVYVSQRRICRLKLLVSIKNTDILICVLFCVFSVWIQGQGHQEEESVYQYFSGWGENTATEKEEKGEFST